MKKRIEASVTGRVQMVMFRDFTVRSARKLGIFGSVRNAKDGSVEVTAEGEEEELEKLLELLKEGSILSHVDEVKAAWMEPQGEFASFSIIYE